MEISKKKFKKEEVELIIEKLRNYYSEKLADANATINDLKEENGKLKFDNEKLMEEEVSFASTIKNAGLKNSELDKILKDKYTLEIENVKEFHENFKFYFDYIVEKYPKYSVINELKDVNEKIDSIIKDNLSSKQKINELRNVIPSNKGLFNPKKKIEEYIASTENNGFNLDEVLNPGELKLEDICKELGLIE